MLRGRLILICAIGVVIVAGVVIAALLLRGSSGSLAEAKESNRSAAAEFPAPTAPEVTATYLQGVGARLLTVLHRVTVEEVAAGAKDQAGCRRSADDLDHSLPPAETVGLIAGVPDDPLRAALGDERNTLAAALTACLDPAVSARANDPVSELLRSAALVDLRLDQLGVRR